MRIGIFSTFAEPAALDLVRSVQSAIKSGEIPNTELAFIFSNRGLVESLRTDTILNRLRIDRNPLVIFSAKELFCRASASTAQAHLLSRAWRRGPCEVCQ